MTPVFNFERDRGGFHFWAGPFGIHVWWEKPRRIYPDFDSKWRSSPSKSGE